MIYRENLHTHTCYCDGDDTPRALVQQALELGFDTLGFSGHSFTSFDDSCCMSREGTQRYCREIRTLAKEYAGKIQILLGIEQDFYADDPASGYDYIIGSVHYVEKNGVYVPLDLSPENFAENISRFWGGNPYAMCRDYFALLAQVVRHTGADIIGHFDVITKFNGNGNFFDESDPRYRRAAIEAADALLATGKPFEINTGPMSRGWRKVPHPAPAWIEYIAANGGTFILSSDCHRKAHLDFAFDSLYTKYGAYLTSFSKLKQDHKYENLCL